MVERKKLCDVCKDIIVPMRDRPKVFDGTIPWCRIEDIEGMYFNKSLSGLMVSEAIIKQMNLKVFPTGTVICSCSATLGVCAINTQPLITNQTFIGLVCSEQIQNRFLYYYMLTRKKELLSLSTTGTIPYVSRDKFEKMIIPIPSIPEQNRIVGILDTFTSSIENLKQQIAERRKQYEFYRDQLLDLEGKEGVVMKTLRDLCLKTSNIKWNLEPVVKTFFYIDLSSVSLDLHQIFVTTEINKENAPSRAQQIVKTGDILLGTTRPTLKRYCQIPLQYDNQICSTGYCVYRANKEYVLSRWIFHNIGNSRFRDYCELKQQGAGYPCLSNSDAFAYSIPVPSLSEQSRIVSILDTFETSISNLEAQLSQREKQYEYYRNKLLTFE